MKMRGRAAGQSATNVLHGQSPVIVIPWATDVLVRANETVPIRVDSLQPSQTTGI